MLIKNFTTTGGRFANGEIIVCVIFISLKYRALLNALYVYGFICQNIKHVYLRLFA